MLLDKVTHYGYKIVKKNMNVPVIKGFKATTFSRAFILNALAASLIATIAIQTREYLDNLTIKHGVYRLSNIEKSFIVASSTFASAIIIYLLLYLFFEFGGGMMICAPGSKK